MLCTGKKRNKSAFTLIELIVVVVALSVVSLAVYATFNNGIKIWQAARREMPEEDLDIFFEKFTTDLRDSFNFKNIVFAGKEDSLEFPTLVGSQKLPRGTVGKITYLYDPGKHVVVRRQMDYSDLYNGENNIEQEMAKDIKALKFQYYVYDPGTQEYLWQEELLTGKLPLAVKVELEMGHDDKINKFSKTVGIPVAN